VEGQREKPGNSEVGLTRALAKISAGVLCALIRCQELLLPETKEERATLCYKTNLPRVATTLVVNGVLLLGDLWRDCRLISRLSVILPLVIGVPSAGHATHILCIIAVREHFVIIGKPMLHQRRRQKDTCQQICREASSQTASCELVEFLINNIYKSRPYVTGNTLRLHYREQPVHAVLGNSLCLLWEYGTHRYSVWVQ
jgi:hypothetical protein